MSSDETVAKVVTGLQRVVEMVTALEARRDVDCRQRTEERARRCGVAVMSGSQHLLAIKEKRV